MTFVAPCAPDSTAGRTGTRPGAALEAVRTAPTILEGIGRSDRLVTAAQEEPDEALPVLAQQIRRGGDQVAVPAAVHALAVVPGPRADTLLTALLDDAAAWVREHTAWSLTGRPSVARAVRGAAVESLVERHRADPAGVAPPDALAVECARAPGPLAPVARLALAEPTEAPSAPPRAGDGLTVPQAFLHAGIDRDLTWEEAEDPEVAAWLAASDRPVVYVSLGSFLSVRADLLAAVAEALRGLDVRVALAAGATPPAALGPVPGPWLVRATLPQVTLLRRASAAISHGGNNIVTEALTAGVPLLLLPLSTDQFAGAAALGAAGPGTVLDPNAATAAEVREATATLLEHGRRELHEQLRHRLTRRPGPERAFTALVC